MLRTEELMIGDWVYHTSMRKYIKISGINGGVLFWYNKTATSACGMSLIEPIPLTPEILEKNGVTKTLYVDTDSYGYCYSDKEILLDLMPIMMNNDNEINFFHFHLATRHHGSMSFSGMKYVHELQNVLRMCGIDKTIEL